MRRPRWRRAAGPRALIAHSGRRDQIALPTIATMLRQQQAAAALAARLGLAPAAALPQLASLLGGQRRPQSSQAAPADTAEGPALPPFDFTPPPYTGPPKEEVLALRKQHLNPSECSAARGPWQACRQRQLPLGLGGAPPPLPVGLRLRRAGRLCRALTHGTSLLVEPACSDLPPLQEPGCGRAAGAGPAAAAPSAAAASWQCARHVLTRSLHPLLLPPRRLQS